MTRVVLPPFEVTLSEHDLVGAFRLHANFRRVGPLLLAVVLLVILLGLILLISPASRLSATSRPLTLLLEGAVGILMLLVAALFAALPAIWRRGARRTLEQREDLAGPVTYTVAPEALTIVTIYSTIRLPWAALRCWRENDALMLLYITDQQFHALPKAEIPPEAMDALHEVLANAQVRRK